MNCTCVTTFTTSPQTAIQTTCEQCGGTTYQTIQPLSGAAPAPTFNEQAYADKLIGLLRHQAQRNHDYAPHACSGCEDAWAILSTEKAAAPEEAPPPKCNCGAELAGTHLRICPKFAAAPVAVPAGQNCVYCFGDHPYGECLKVALPPPQEPLDFHARLADTLCNVSQLLDGWHADGTAWSEWDESVRKSVGTLALEVENTRKRIVPECSLPAALAGETRTEALAVELRVKYVRKSEDDTEWWERHEQDSEGDWTFSSDQVHEYELQMWHYAAAAASRIAQLERERDEKYNPIRSSPASNRWNMLLLSLGCSVVGGEPDEKTGLSSPQWRNLRAETAEAALTQAQGQKSALMEAAQQIQNLMARAKVRYTHGSGNPSSAGAPFEVTFTINDFDWLKLAAARVYEQVKRDLDHK